MKKVALIQSRVYFTPALQQKYLGNIPILTTSDPIEIYKFIKRNVNKNCIFKYVLHINSGVLDKLIDYIFEQKNKSVNAQHLLSKCILLATLSNADIVRQKNLEKNTNINFSLSPLSEVMKSIVYPPNKSLLVVSDRNTPYYNQIWNSNVTPKYRVSELNVDIINEFAKTGIIIQFAGDTFDEYMKFANLIVESNYTQTVASIELIYTEIINPIRNKVSSFFIRSAGVAISGNINKYIDLNNYVLYDNCAAVLVDTYKYWEQYIKKNIISVESPDYNIDYYFF